REAGRFFFIRRDAPHVDEFLDVLPVRNDEAFESKLSTQDVSQNVMIDVTRNAVDLARVDHDRARAGFDCGLECWEKVFAQVILRNPRGRAISSGEGKTVAHV